MAGRDRSFEEGLPYSIVFENLGSDRIRFQKGSLEKIIGNPWL